MNQLARLLFLTASTVTLAACGGGGGSTGSGGGGSGGSSNSAPSVTSPTSFTFPEDQEVIFGVTVNDPDGDTVTITIDTTTGDGDKFLLNTSNGNVRANTDDARFNFEAPVDSNADNVYTQTISISDGIATIRETFTVTITDVDEPPSCESGQIVPVEENFTGDIHQLVGSDPEGEPGVFGLTQNQIPADLGGKIEVDPVTGVVTLTGPLDFETVQSPMLEVDARFALDSFNVNCSFTIEVLDRPAGIGSGLIIEGIQSAANSLGPVLDSTPGDLWVKSSRDVEDMSDDGTGPQEEDIGIFVGAPNIIDPITDTGAGTISLDTAGSGQINRFTFTNTDADGVLISTILKAEAIGDLDGDGFGEFVIVQPTLIDGTENVAATLIWGGQLALAVTPEEIDLSDMPEGLGISLTSSTVRNFGRLGSLDVGDLNNDGVADLVIGFPFYSYPFDGPDRNLSSRTYVISGQALQAVATDRYDLDAQSFSDVMIFSDRSNDMTDGGHGVAILSGLDGDMLDELMISDRDQSVIWKGSDIFSDPAPFTYHDYTSVPEATKIFRIRNLGETRVADEMVDFDSDGKDEILFSNANGSATLINGATIIFPSGSDTATLDISDSSASGFTTVTVDEGALDGKVDTLTDANGDGVPEIVIGREVLNEGDTALKIVSGDRIINEVSNALDLRGDETGDVVSLVNSTFSVGLGFSVTENYENLLDTSLPVQTEDIYLPLLTEGIPGQPSLIVPGDPQAYLLLGKDIRAAFDAGQTEIDLKALFDNE